MDFALARLFALGKHPHAKRYALIALVGLVLFSAGLDEVCGPNGYIARGRRRAKMQALTVDIQHLQQDNEQLTGQIQRLRSDPQIIEKLAREQLRLGRPGDVVITLAPPHDPPK